MMIAFSLVILVLLGGIVLAVVGGGSSLSQRSSHEATFRDDQRTTPREILDKRLARGEIDRDEYEAIRARLEN